MSTKKVSTMKPMSACTHARVRNRNVLRKQRLRKKILRMERVRRPVGVTVSVNLHTCMLWWKHGALPMVNLFDQAR